MLLTDAERLKFADYLELEAQSADGIAEQMEKMIGAALVASPAIATLAKRNRTLAMASRVVAARLRNAETQTLEPPRA